MKYIKIAIELIIAAIKKINISGVFCTALFISFPLSICSEQILESIGIGNIISLYKPYITLICYASIMYFVYRITKNVYVSLNDRVKRHKLILECHNKLRCLSIDEQNLLIESFYDDDNNRFTLTGYLDLGDGRNKSLSDSGIIYLSSQYTHGVYIAYNLYKNAYKYLNECLEKSKLRIDADLKIFQWD